MAINEREAVQLLLVRAVEEQQPELFSPELFSGAALSALHTETDAGLLERRAAYLFDHLPKSLKVLERISLLPEIWTLPVIIGTFVIGAASNYLGPSGQVHVAYNPIVILLGWNLFIYLALLWSRRRFSLQDRRRDLSAADHPLRPTGPGATADSRSPSGPVAWLLHALLRDFFCWWYAWRARVRDSTEIWRSAAYFARIYSEVARPLLTVRLRYLLHLAAVGIALGAVAGIYLRGLFFDYATVWQSTFVHAPATITVLLNVILGPAALFLDGRFLNPADIQPLLQSGGTPAAPWIHRLATMVLAVVIVPRTILLIVSAKRSRRAAEHVEIDLTDSYYRRTIETARQGTIHRVRDEVATLIRLEIAKQAEASAIFVRENLFEKRIVPSLITFRNKGGKIADLELEIAKQGGRFQEELKTFLEKNRIAFQEALASGIGAILGRERWVAPATPALRIHDSADRVGDQLAGSVASNLSDLMGATIGAAVAAAVGTISGGIGQTLGIAIISTLLGTSGPVGLLIGGIGAFVVASGAYMMGRERITGQVKNWTVPAVLAKIALRDTKLEEAKAEVYRKVKDQVEDQLELHAADINREVFHVVSMLAMDRRAT